MNAREVLVCLHGVKKSRSGWIARCPAHNDRLASLSVAEGRDNRVLFHCFAGCLLGEILSAIGFEPSDLFPSRSSRGLYVQKTPDIVTARQRTIERFESWRNQQIRRLNLQFRILSRCAQEARNRLREGSEKDAPLHAIAQFVHQEADLSRALDFLICVKRSPWLAKDSTIAEVFRTSKERNNRAE